MTKPETVFLTVDIVVMVDDEILLIRRKNSPFAGKWALPGGFVDKEEDLETAARRELQEETGIHSAVEFSQVGAFGSPNRDPRGRTVSVAFKCMLDKKPQTHAGSDAAKTGWFSCQSLPSMAFDHADIIKLAIKTENI